MNEPRQESRVSDIRDTVEAILSPQAPRRERTLAERERDCAMQKAWEWELRARRSHRRATRLLRTIQGLAVALALTFALAICGWLR